MQQQGLREQAVASLLSVATAAGLSQSVRLAALRTFADAQALPSSLGETSQAVLLPLQLSAVAALAAAAAAAHIAAGTNEARAREVALLAVWHAARKVLGEEWVAQYSRDALADAAFGGGGSGGSAARAQDPSVWDHLVALHARLQAWQPFVARMGRGGATCVLDRQIWTHAAASNRIARSSLGQHPPPTSLCCRPGCPPLQRWACPPAAPSWSCSTAPAAPTGPCSRVAGD